MTPIASPANSKDRTRTADFEPASLPATTPLVSIVIVNFCQWRNTARLVRQLMASAALRRGQAEIVVVDNHSPPHSLRRRLRRMSGVSLRCLRHNHGFAAGVNEACRLSRGAWFVMLNPDVTVGPGWIDRLLAHLSQSDLLGHTGVIGIQLRDADGALQGSVGSFPTLLSTLAGQFRPRAVRKCRVWRGQGGEAAWVTGCGLLVRRACFEQIGGLDRSFFLYYEDADFCKRSREAGWSVRHEPRLAIKHLHPLHQRPLSPRMRLLTRHSLLVYAGKHWGAWSCLAIAAIVWFEALVRGSLSRERGEKKRFQGIRALARDFVCGRERAAYRRAWRAAQPHARTHAKPPAAEHARRQRHERRPVPQ